MGNVQGVDFDDIETALGLTPGTVLSLGGYNATFGSAIYRSVTVLAGEAITFDSRFVSDEPDGPTTPYNDFSFFSVSGGGAPAHVQFLGDAQAASSINGPAFHGFDRSTNSANASYTFANSGTYTIGFGVSNVEDNSVGSALVVDNIALNVQNPQSVPEIDASSATLPLALICLMMLVVSDRKHRATRLA